MNMKPEILVVGPMMPNLEIIALYGVRVDAIDLSLAKKPGIPVTTTPDVLTEDVADMALALLLATARRIVVGHQYLRTGQWAVTLHAVRLLLKVEPSSGHTTKLAFF